jgi:small-conductance mechanosensitive channel
MPQLPHLAPKLVTWLIRGAGALVATILLIWLLGRLGAILNAIVERIEERMKLRGRGVGYRSVEILSIDAILQLVRSAIGAVRVVASIAAIYLWILAVAWALDKGGRVFPLVVSPFLSAVRTVGAAAVAFIPNLIFLLVIITVARFAGRTVGLFADAVAEGRIQLPGLERDLATPTRRLVTLLIWVIALVMAVPYLPGSDSRAFQGVAVIFGVLVSLGSSSVVSNLLSGLVLTYTRAYRVGDRVRIGDVVGDVVGLGTFTTRIRTIKNEEVSIPNAVVQGGNVHNYSRYARDGKGVQVHTTVTIGYETPWRKVHELLILAAHNTPGLKSTPEPYVLQLDLDDFYVRYEVCAYCDRPNDLHLIEAALNEQIQDEFFAEKVEICSPHYETQRENNAPAIPRNSQLPPPADRIPRVSSIPQHEIDVAEPDARPDRDIDGELR